MSQHNALELNNVTFAFTKASKPFFQNINACFAQHKLHFIRGQNGTGKSTLLRLLQADIHQGELIEGTLLVKKHKFNLSSPHKLHHLIASVPQKFDTMIAQQFSFKDNCSFALFEHFPLFKKKPKQAHIPDLVKNFRIDMDIPVCQLSGGQRQILAITMALQQHAQVLLLDEPTATLDENNADMVMHFLQNLTRQERLTVILVSHDRSLFERYAQKTYFELIIDHQTEKRTIIQHIIEHNQ